ncbi:MAG: efflux transporter periplasmic adaptor subunit [Bdellovibrionaceae bacterium]|nr:efflux transporter periplasmic adaptor subunit [Pseudobdellovibrionaceae bacterium]|tara:strand:- start:96611 stop:97999 length:1389 start_codon:yes stop_codon:yes gene_type:complete
MNKLISIIFLMFLLVIGVSCQKEGSSESSKTHEGHEHSKTKVYYTCSMHPQIKEKEMGKCPICHMNLTKIEVDDEEDIQAATVVPEKDIWQCKDFPDVTSETEDVCPMDGTPMVKKPKENKAAKVVAKVKLRKAQLKHFEPDFFPVTTMKMTKKIRLLGSVLQSEEKESNIPARIGGRVEKVYVKSTGSMVKVGDPVIDLYSPKLITAGEEYLLARKSYAKSKTKEFKDMLEQSIERLKLWGIKRFQFENWYKKGKVPRQITIYSNATGIVRSRNATVGKYFKEGQNFFELSDLADVWVEMDVYEHDSSLIKIGQKVDLEFTAIPGEKLVGEIDFVNPVLDQKSRTLKVRATIENASGKLKPGMIANAVLNVDIEGMPLVVPRTAVIDTGKRKVVWVKVSGKNFQAKTVHAGYESEGYVEIKHGLMEGEEVVIEGNFLLDAQAQLFGGYEDMKEPKTSGHNH